MRADATGVGQADRRASFLPSGAHKSRRGVNETDIKESNCGVMCTNKNPTYIFIRETPPIRGTGSVCVRARGGSRISEFVRSAIIHVLWLV